LNRLLEGATAIPVETCNAVGLVPVGHKQFVMLHNNHSGIGNPRGRILSIIILNDSLPAHLAVTSVGDVEIERRHHLKPGVIQVAAGGKEEALDVDVATKGCDFLHLISIGVSERIFNKTNKN
jgi:hypothetical protein